MKPPLAITLGDPAGIGPEIVAKIWRMPEVHDWCRPIAVGRPEILERAVALVQSDAEVVAVQSPEEAEPTPRRLPCLVAGPPEAINAPTGQVSAEGGEAAFAAVVAAARLALAGHVAGLVTSPLNKEALHRAGHGYPGHTELLAELCGVRDFAMMLYLGPDGTLASPHGLAVVHVTLHTALRNALAELQTEGVLAKARLADQFMRRLTGQRPRIGVCSLNPHGGEGGLFGDEELRIIRPAIERGRTEGLDLTGPLPADTLMVRAREGHFDAIVAMFHDQGHIALKLLGMHRAVNVTLGLPIVRTSVAHGTAFDIAWRGEARASSLMEAVRVAARLCQTAG